MRKILPYRSDLKDKAQNLRQNATLSEVLLWNHLKQKKMYGYRFHRQKPLLDYIVDFYAPELKLAIEIDGSSHNESADQDRRRQNEIEKLGVHFLRFLDGDVKHRIDEVIITIQEWIEQHGRSQLIIGSSLKTHPGPAEAGSPLRRRGISSFAAHSAAKRFQTEGLSINATPRFY